MLHDSKCGDAEMDRLHEIMQSRDATHFRKRQCGSGYTIMSMVRGAVTELDGEEVFGGFFTSEHLCQVKA